MTTTMPTQSQAWTAVLPEPLLSLQLGALELPLATVVALAGAGMQTVADVLAAPVEALAGRGPLAQGRAQDVALALQRALAEGLAPRQLTASDWPTLRTQLLAPLGELERRWFEEIVGLVGDPPNAATLARQLGITVATLNERADRLRAAFSALAPDLVERLHHEASMDLRANDGVMQVVHAAVDSIVHRLARSAPEPGFGLRLVAFLFPQECCQSHGALFAMTPRRHRRLLRLLPGLVPPRRLPKPLDELLEELRALDLPTTRGVLVHVLRANMRVAIVLDAEVGEVAVADPRTPTARLAELLADARGPRPAADLASAYRERYRAGSTKLVRRLLRERGLFLRIGEDLWALRRDHEAALAAAATLVDRVARRLCAIGGRQRVSELIEDGETDERTQYYVLDGLADDPRVRLLGRGDACPATHRQSLVMTKLLEAFRRAGGDVVLDRFLANQPESHRRLTERLLQRNRMFVQFGDDRVDVLSNWPFNDERMQRLLAMVEEQLQRRAGYSHTSAIKAALDLTDLGGPWLTLPLLEDVLRRNGPFDVLPGGIVGRIELDLIGFVRRTLRTTLRGAGTTLTVDEILQQRPDLAPFASTLAGMLRSDPMIRSDDDVRFTID
ncbi:MAG: hypothetical protein ACK5BN_20790 [Planctomycetota bacterium]